MICRNAAPGQATASSCTQHLPPGQAAASSCTQHLRPRPGSSLIWRRYGGGVGNRGRWADRFAISEQRQSMERHFQRSRELFRTDRGRPCPREWEDPQAKRCGGMERSGSLCGRGYRSAEAAAAASGSSCELANPAQVCQSASQTGVLFSARCGLLPAGAPMCRLPARALMGSNRRGADEQVASRGPMGSDGRSTNEVLLTGAPGRRAIGKQLGAKEATASKGRTCWQGNTLRARVAPAGKGRRCWQRCQLGTLLPGAQTK